MWLLAAVVVLIGFSILGEISNPLLKDLGARYAVPWKYFGWLRAESIYVSRIGERRYWINHVSIEMAEDGLAIYFPFFKRYLKSFEIPWAEIEYVDIRRAGGERN